LIQRHRLEVATMVFRPNRAAARADPGIVPDRPIASRSSALSIRAAQAGAHRGGIAAGSSTGRASTRRPGERLRPCREASSMRVRHFDAKINKEGEDRRGAGAAAAWVVTGLPHYPLYTARSGDVTGARDVGSMTRPI